MPPIHHPQNFKRINKEMYEKKNNVNYVIFEQVPLVIFCAFLSFLARNFLEGVIIGLVPKMLERSPANVNSRRISDSGKTVS